MARLLLTARPLLFARIGIVLVCLTWGTAPSGQAQDDIFADSAPTDSLDFGMPQLDATAAADDRSPSSTLAVNDPFVEQLRRLAGGQPRQVAMAIREAIRQELWAEASRFLTSSHFQSFDPATRAQIAKQVGGVYLARGLSAAPLSDAALLTDAARTQLEQLQTTLVESAADPQKLAAALRTLGQGNVDEQATAARTLLRGGDEAMQQLLRAAISQNPPALRADIVRLLREFDQPAVEATAQLARFGTDEIRPAALAVLYRLAPEAAAFSFAAALHAAGSTPAERELAAAALARLYPEPPDARTTEAMLAEQLRLAEDEYFATRASDAPVTVWRIDEARQFVQPLTLSTAAAQAAQAADFAELLRRQGEMQSQTLVMAMAAALRHAYLTNPSFGSDTEIEQWRNQWGDAATDTGRIDAVLTHYHGGGLQAAQHPLDVAALAGAARLLGHSGNAQVLATKHGEPAPLVQLVDHPSPRVRFEAATAVGMLAGKQPFAGSGRVLDCWLEMAALGDLPKALLLVNQPPLAQELNEQLTRLGFLVVRVATVQELIRHVDAGADLQLIVATTQPPDFSAIEMLDRVRRRPLGAMVPVALIGPRPRGANALHGGRWTGAVTIIEMPSDEMRPGDAGDPRQLARKASAELQAQLDLLRLATPLMPLSAGEREAFVREGARNLASLAEDRELERVYAWRDRESDLIAAFQREGYSPEAMKVLSALGSPRSQALLATIVATPTLDEETRSEAAAGFEASIQRFGTRMTRSEVQQQYDRFNASRDTSTRQLLGRVLDAMEARVGVSSK